MASSSHSQNSSLHSYQSWKSARDSLSLAIRSYISACDNLTSDYNSGLLRPPSDSRFAHHQVAEFEAELSTLPQEEERLQNARAGLVQFQNRIPKLVKIHQLPPEILSRIFLESHQAWITRQDDRGFSTVPTVLSSVCRSWRSVTLAFPSIWSCIDIAVDAPNSDASFECAQLWAARSASAPLSIDICHSNEGFNDPLEVSDSGISKLISVLAPIASQIRHLKTSSYLASCLHDYVLICLVNFGTPGLLASLEVEVEECEGYPLELFPLKVPKQLESPSPQRIDEFLQSITNLILSGFIISWESPIYSGLVELSVFFPDSIDGYTHGPEDLAQALQSSPQLRVVSLTNHEYANDGLSTAPTPPIYLKDLQSLTLSSGANGYSPLLPLFAPGTVPLYLKIELEGIPTFNEELGLFFNRSNVTTLWAKACEQSWFSALHHRLSRLESLTLEGCDFSDPSLVGFLDEQHTGRTPSLWPCLTSLRLLNCYIKGDTLERLLAAHRVGRVQIDYTQFHPWMVRDEEGLMVRRLREHVPDTVISCIAQTD
ncbi:hypothetical protein FS749_005397 [Ceratobasidium sp. UAMH 11750]|nr:hypothetical protein FS749_005397 [Ceratobasidium sp. UAMH 11750]